MTESNNFNPCLENGISNDINKTLMSDTEEIFGEELKTDDSTLITESESGSIKVTNVPEQNSIPDYQWISEYSQRLLAVSSPITWEYHKSEIENVNRIITTTLSLTKLVSLSTICLVALFTILDKNTGAIISGITGGIIDSILAVLAGLFNSTLKSKKSYFDSESETSKFNKMLLIVQTISNQIERDTVIAEIVRKFFEIDTK